MPAFDLEALLREPTRDEEEMAVDNASFGVPADTTGGIEPNPAHDAPFTPAAGRNLSEAVDLQRSQVPFFRPGLSQHRTPRARSFAPRQLPDWAAEAHTSARQPELSRPARVQVPPSYPAAPRVALDCGDQWRNDMGLFLGRSFRVCFSANGDIYMPKPCFGANAPAPTSADAGAHQIVRKTARGSLLPDCTSHDYASLLRAHLEMSDALNGAAAKDKGAVMGALERYCRAAQGMPIPASVLACVCALQAGDSKSLLASFSEWLQSDLACTVEQAVEAGANVPGASPYDKIFILLTGKQVDEACLVAQDECCDHDLAVILSQAGEGTSLPEDMQALVEWLEAQEQLGPGLDDGSLKLLQIYRLLAGQVDDLLSVMSEDLQRGGEAQVVGGGLLDWRRCLGLFLWYASPRETTMKLPPEGMAVKRADMFLDARKLPLSLQGAVQHSLAKCWEARRNGAHSSAQQTVPHPWPAYLEEDEGMGMERSLPSHLLRTLVYRGREEACARMSPAVRRRLGWSRNHKPVAPAAGVLRPISAASAGADWDGWAVDVRLELANLVFPTGLPGDASLARLLETDSNSALGLDSEMSWHLHEILARLAVLGKTGAKAGGKLAERLWGLRFLPSPLPTQPRLAQPEKTHQIAESSSGDISCPFLPSEEGWVRLKGVVLTASTCLPQQGQPPEPELWEPAALAPAGAPHAPLRRAARDVRQLAGGGIRARGERAAVAAGRC